MKRLLDLDPLTGLQTWFCDNQDGTFHLEETQPVEALMDFCKAQANDPELTKQGIKQSWMKYASIPPILLHRWSMEVGGDILSKKYEKEFFRRINNPDFKYFKTTDGWYEPKG